MEGTSPNLSAGFAGNQEKEKMEKLLMEKNELLRENAELLRKTNELLKETAEKNCVDLGELTKMFEKLRQGARWASGRGDVDAGDSLEELVNQALKRLQEHLAALPPSTEEKQWWEDAWEALQQGPPFPILKTLEMLLPHLTEEHQTMYAERLKSFGDPAAALFGILSEFSNSLQETLPEKLAQLFSRKMTDRERVAAHGWIVMKNSGLRLGDEEAYIRGLMATPWVVIEMLECVKRM
jgi:hypothetical protein